MEKEDYLMKNMANEVPDSDEVLFQDDRSLEDIIREVAEEEGMTYEETLKLFQDGLKIANRSKVNPKNKSKAKAKRKSAKQARRKNRK